MKSKFAFIFILLICTNISLSAETQDYQKESDGFEWYRVRTDNWKNEGAKDKYGNVLVPITYADVYYSLEDNIGYFLAYTSFQDGRKVAVYDKNGKIIIPLSRGYKGSVYCDNVYTGYENSQDQPYWYFVITDNETHTIVICNLNGTEIFRSEGEYSRVTPHYDNGYFYYEVNDANDNSKTQIIDAQGKIIVPYSLQPEHCGGLYIYNGNFRYCCGCIQNGAYIDSNWKDTGIKLSSITTTKNYLDINSYESPVLLSKEEKEYKPNVVSEKNYKQSEYKRISLNDMIGKHYVIIGLITESSIWPLEGDLGIAKSGVVIVYGDGNGYADEFHVYSIEDLIKNTLWTTKNEKGEKGYIELISYQDNYITVAIRENENKVNFYLIKDTPYDKPTLKLR